MYYQCAIASLPMAANIGQKVICIVFKSVLSIVVFSLFLIVNFCMQALCIPIRLSVVIKMMCVVVVSLSIRL